MKLASKYFKLELSDRDKLEILAIQESAKKGKTVSVNSILVKAVKELVKDIKLEGENYE